MPQRNFKRKSSGKFLRNLESSTEETRLEDKGLGSQNEENTSMLSEKGESLKGGSVVPNRVFIGGISANTTEWDIRSRFSAYGNIRAVKILRDVNGISRGYGFVTFDTEEEAKATVKKGEIIFKGRKLNVAPAVKKQSYRSEQRFPTGSCDFGNYSGSFSYEQIARNKGYEELSEYTGYEADDSAENPRACIVNGTCLNAANLQSSDYGSAQMNFMPYPTWVYIPQQPYPGTGITYPINGNMLELIQVLPAPLCFFNGEPK